jgi:hypothetical protein
MARISEWSKIVRISELSAMVARIYEEVAEQMLAF